jgi:serine/threonine-protein kinase
MSPEQCTGKGVDNRSDLFSLGVVLYEWLTGFKLFTGESEVAVLKSITEGKIYAPSYFKSDIPEAVEAILMKALDKDREKRYQSAWEMQYDIDQFLSEHEFTPSNIHLSNFLKQLFNDELEEEKKRIARPINSAGPEEIVPQEESIESDSVAVDEDIQELPSAPMAIPTGHGIPIGAMPTVASSPADQTIAVSFSAAELESLAIIARKHGMSVGSLIRDVLVSWLRYR